MSISVQATSIRDYFETPSRFFRSTNLERDIDDVKALETYTLTPFVADALLRIAEGVNGRSGRRAWRITGDYGVGKSSFALFLAHYFSAQRSRQISGLLRKTDVVAPQSKTRLIPILVTGERESLARAIIRAVRTSLGNLAGRPTQALKTLMSAADKAGRAGTPLALCDLLDGVAAFAKQQDAGVLLIIDEMGKFLEFAASSPEQEDIFLLQTLAERAVRSGATPFVFLALLHQGFQAYAEKLPFAQRHEWEKVASRFEEIVFDQPLVHTAALAARALGVRTAELPRAVVNAARRKLEDAMSTGFFAGTPIENAALLYPLHPLVLPVLIRFFARFGQHERSLFGFLLSNEPFGLQAFSASPIDAGRWYCLSDFFDYVRAVFGHRLSGESYRSSWLRLIELVDRASNLPDSEVRLIKTVAILNLLDTDDLVATDSVLAAATGQKRDRVSATTDHLIESGFLFRRGQAGSLRLWSGASVNLKVAIEEALKSVGEPENRAEQIAAYLDQRPIAARRHYLTTGTLRYFDVRWASVAALEEAVNAAPAADGAVIVALPLSSGERSLACLAAERSKRDDVIVVIPEAVGALTTDLREARAWEIVIANTVELADDPYGLAEADRQLKRAASTIATGLEAALGIRSEISSAAIVYHQGKRIKFGTTRRLAPLVSEVCGNLYPDAPKIMNELLNRNALSSAAAAARMRLIEGLFVSPNEPLLGIDEQRAPPEKSMYLSVLSAGNVHRLSKGRYFIDEPPIDDDPLRLRPALAEITNALERAKGARVPVRMILEKLRGKPFGVRDGVAPLLFAIVTSTRAHEIAVYENGTFLHHFGPADFLRLTKQPDIFELQLCRVAGVRAEVFRRLLDCFSSRQQPSGRHSELLDVVTPLCRFAAQLPEYTRRLSQIDAEAMHVRDALLTTTDPSELIFKSLPEACGVRGFEIDGRRDQKRTETFIARLQEATNRLRDAYPALLTDVVSDVGRSLGVPSGSVDRGKIAARAARVALAAREGRLRAFAQRLRDPGLSEDAWIEALASFVVSKPPSRWIKIDLDNWKSEIEGLGETFLRVEAAAYSSGPEPSKTAVRIGLTRADGVELARVIDVPQDNSLDAMIDKVEKHLPKTRDMRLALFYKLLWSELKSPKNDLASDAQGSAPETEITSREI